MLKVADIDVAYGHAKVLYNIFLELEAGKLFLLWVEMEQENDTSKV